MNPVIGILGGMGPRATVQFEQRLLDRLPGVDQAVPTIVTINDGSIPDRSRFLLGEGPDPVPQLQRNLGLLERSGAAVICLPCNTACAPAIFSRLRPRVSRLVNLPAEVGRSLTARSLNLVYVLGTTGTLAAGTYQTICRQVGIRCLVPSPTIQEKVSRVIALVKAGKTDVAEGVAVELSRVIAQSGAQGVILGCTELSLVSQYLVPSGVVAVDTLDVLADSAIRYTKIEELKGVYNDARPVYA